MSSSSAVSPSEDAVDSTASADRSTRPSSSFMSAFQSGEWLKDKLTHVLTAVPSVWDERVLKEVVSLLSAVALESENTAGRMAAIVVLSAMASEAVRQCLHEQNTYLGMTGVNVVTALALLRDGNWSDPTHREMQACFVNEMMVEIPSLISEYEKALASPGETSVLDENSPGISTVWNTIKTSFAGIKHTSDSEVRQRYAQRPAPKQQRSGPTIQDLQKRQAELADSQSTSSQPPKRSKKPNKPRHKPGSK